MRKKEDNLFFEFLQVAIGIRRPLSVAIGDSDWLRLFEFCKRQTLVGIGFAAVEKLHTVGIVCPVNLRMKWMALALQIEKKNALLNEQCKKLTEQYEHDGLSTCILKGQGNCLNYPEELRMRRMPGDIDVWCIPPKDGLNIAVATGDNDVEYVNYKGVNAVIEYARMQYRLKGIDANPKACYHHIETPAMDGTEVEVHYRPAFLRSPLRNWRMQRWFENHTDECMKNKTHLGFSMMTSSVNVVYQMCHLYTHIFEGGFGLRQLMDYYFALRVWHNDVMECKDLQSQGMWSEGLGTAVMSATEVMAVLRSFGMGKFAAAVMYILQEVFAMPTLHSINDDRLMINDCPWLLCEPNVVEGKKLLEEIMQGGNFGQYDTRDATLKKGGMVKHGVWKLKRVMRLVSSYPEEAMWEPVFRVWHLVWRGING